MTSLMPRFYYEHVEPEPQRPPLPAVIQDIIDDHNELVAWLKELGYSSLAD